MQTFAGNSAIGHGRDRKRLWIAALLAGTAATLVDFLIATLMAPLIDAPADYPSFTWLPLLAGCMFGAVGGAIALIEVERFSRRPRRTFLMMAAVVLLLSYSLPILPIVHPLQRFAGVNWEIAFTLMFMHTVTAVIIVTSLLQFGNTEGPTKQPV